MTSLVLALAISAPPTDQPIGLRFQYGLRPDFVQAGWRAARYWNCALGTEIFVPHKGAWRVWVYQSGELTFKGKFVFAIWERVDTQDSIYLHWINRTRQIRSVEQTFRHELGHVLGLPEETRGIMGPADWGVAPHQASSKELEDVRKRFRLKAPNYDPKMCYGELLWYSGHYGRLIWERTKE